MATSPRRYAGLLGDGAPLSASSVQRLTEDWQRDDAQWRTQDLSALEPVYVWAHGSDVKAVLESTKAALLVLITALADGTNVVLAVESGHRESSERFCDLAARGLPAPAQRCWNHKLRNVVDVVPLKNQHLDGSPDWAKPQGLLQGGYQRVAPKKPLTLRDEEGKP